MSESVKVAVRCRPMSLKELQQGNRSVISIDRTQRTCTLDSVVGGGPGKVYQFDATYGQEATTEFVYEEVGSVVVEALLEGYNGTVFAYGQTGCGKSFTMRSFIERSLEHLFEATSTSGSETRYLALLSYLEIYNEKLRDLLQDGNSETLQLKEDPSRGTYVAGGLREITVKDAGECMRLVQQGDKRRALAATKMNAVSSRSHAVLTLALEAIAINDDAKKDGNVRKGRLHLVDLAGSERQSRTGAAGDRLKEAASINLSLSALGNVISALAAGNGRHVPYRDSKLTRLLRDSLGGNARTLMIACVSPCDVDGEETLSTLRYAARARCIKNKPVVNEDPKDALLRQYQLELQKLRKLLESSDGTRIEDSLNTDDRPRSETGDEDNSLIEKLKRECEESNLSSKKLQEELMMLKSRIDSSPQPQQEEDADPELSEKRRKRQETAKQEVLKRLEKLTIGGEARQDAEVQRRRERRRKRLCALAEALEKSERQGAEGAFEVYGQLRTTEDALKRMAKRVKQLEQEAGDLQASWDAERRELLRRELLATQIGDAMLPHLRPGCPLRDLEFVRTTATWCDELGRWRLPDGSAARIISLPMHNSMQKMKDYNNNGSGNSVDEDMLMADCPPRLLNSNSLHSGEKSTADSYFRRSRVDALLGQAKIAKTFESLGRLSKSGGAEDASSSELRLSALNLQSDSFRVNKLLGQKPSPVVGLGWTPSKDKPKNAWMTPANTPNKHKKNPPRILEALPPAHNPAQSDNNMHQKQFDENHLNYQNNYHPRHAQSPTC